MYYGSKHWFSPLHRLRPVVHFPLMTNAALSFLFGHVHYWPSLWLLMIWSQLWQMAVCSAVLSDTAHTVQYITSHQVSVHVHINQNRWRGERHHCIKTPLILKSKYFIKNAPEWTWNDVVMTTVLSIQIHALFLLPLSNYTNTSITHWVAHTVGHITAVHCPLSTVQSSTQACHKSRLWSLVLLRLISTDFILSLMTFWCDC